ncbi:MAG: hypothetical protein FVQ84_03960 [Planctomycetes bacterium]|nr:hypothetical protein [Planctomycetota bacterium]
MSESVNVENKKQNRQKPPLSIAGIACEILAGATAGLAIAVPFAYVIGTVFDDGGDFGGMAALGIILLVSPMVYGLGSAVGVYLLGSRGKQTGSLLLTLVCGFVGGLAMPFSLPMLFSAPSFLSGVERIVLKAVLLLIQPIIATIGFNLTRRYKEPPSS